MQKLALIILVAGCAGHDVVDPIRDETHLLQTDKAEYTLERMFNGRGTHILITYSNTLPDTIYIVNCNGSFGTLLQRREADWTTVWSPVIPACLSQPIVIPPGTSYSKQILVWGADSGTNTYPQFPTGDLDGVYRLQIWSVVKHYSDRAPGFGEAIPVELRSSTEFRLVDPS